MAQKYDCECIKCGHELQTEKHCRELKCPKCGAQMRRKERPGPGQSLTERIPASACVLQLGQLLSIDPALDDAGQKRKQRRFQMNAHTGRIMSRTYFGQTAIDLAGVKVNRQRMPALLAHDDAAIAGWTEKIDVDKAKGILVDGIFAETTETGRQVLGLADEGFPWQASIYIPPTKIERVDEGESAEVNGQTMKGPGVIFRKSVLREASFCALGADEHTSAAALAEGDSIEVTVEGRALDEAAPRAGQEEEMGLEELKLEALRAERPDLLKQIEEDARAAGTEATLTAERERVAQIHKDAAKFAEFEGRDELARAHIEKGVAPEQAMLAMREARLKAVEEAAPASPGPNPAPEETRGSLAGMEGDELFKAEWEKGTKKASAAELHGEFADDADAYGAYRRAEEKGLVEILRK